MKTLNALVARSMKMAQPIAQSYAEGNMPHRALITRVVDRTFDRDTGTLSGDSRYVVYEGEAGFYSETGGEVYQLGDEPQYFATTYVSIPLSAERPQIDDDVQIMAHSDAALVGRHYRVTGVAEGGRLPASRKLTIVGAEPAPNVTL